MPSSLKVSESLLSAAIGGEPEARESLLRALGPRLRVMVLVRLPGRSRAGLEDLCQDLALAICEGIGSLRDAKLPVFRAWLSTLVKRIVQRKLRRDIRKEMAVSAMPGSRPRWLEVDRAGGEALTMEVVARLTGTGVTPSSLASREEQLELVLRKLGELGERQREALTLAFFDQLDTAQVGETLGISRPAAAMLIHRGLSVLREHFDPEKTPGSA